MQYAKENLEKMLKEHRKNEARLTELELRQEEYEERLEYAGTVYEDTSEEVIENMQLAAQSYDKIPSYTNRITDKTFETATRYGEEQIYVNKENRKFLERKIEECKNEKKRLNKIIVRIKNLLNQLTKEQRFVITSYYLEKSKWDYISDQYFIEYQKPKSINQLLNIRNTAIESMLDILNTGI